jgi:flavodoxin
MTKKLIAYFSASGITEKIAKKIAELTDSDIYEIKPKVKYTAADLNWMDKNSRSSIEMSEYTSRPEIVDDNFSTDEYDTIFLGFPIWWYMAPTIVNTFLEKHDFSNKKIVVFATSGGSRLGNTIEKLRLCVSETAKFIDGGVLNGSPSQDALKEWYQNLKIS